MSDKIGDRITFWKEKDKVEIHISGKVKPWQESLLFAWLGMWTLCGLYIMVFFFQELNMEEKLFLFVYLVFWGYFEYIVGRTWMWRKWGKEVIQVEGGNLELTNQVRKSGQTNRYFVQNIKNLSFEAEKSSFISIYFNSFWIRGGERISFQYMGKEVRFGRQLSEDECKRLLSVLKKYLRKK